MNIKSLTLFNWQLFRKETINFESINIIKGINYDSSDSAGNGSGKTTIISAILFCLFGQVFDPKLNLSDLISIGAKKAKITLEFEHKGQQWKIARSIPSDVEIYIDEIKKDFNTATIAQTFIEEQIGSTLNFKTYHLIDKIKGINLLDLGNVSLQGNLTGLMDSLFSTHRKSLNAKKLNVETYSIDKRFYKFHLSDKRLQFLKNGLNKLEEVHGNILQSINDQQGAVNSLLTKIQSNDSQCKFMIKEGQNKDKHGLELRDYIITNQKAAELLKNAPLKEQLEIEDFNEYIEAANKDIEFFEQKLKIFRIEETELNKKVHQIELDKTMSNGDLNLLSKERTRFKEEIKGLESAIIGTKCKHCGSLISEDHKEEAKQDLVKKIEGLNITNVSIDFQIEIYNKGMKQLYTEIEETQANIKKEESEVSKTSNILKELNLKKSEQERILNEISQEASKKEANINQYLKVAEEADKQYSQITMECAALKDNIVLLEQETVKINNQLVADQDYLKIVQDNELKTKQKIQRTERFIDKLQEAFKFKEYRYTEKDKQLYADSIKVFDGFTAFYIKENLQNLEVIINDLLAPINLSVEFTSDKEFLYLKDNGVTLKYGMLSSGQKTFLNCILKLGILLNEGKTEMPFIIDDGVSDIDKINLNKLLTISENLPMQFFVIYQNYEEEKYNQIMVERKNGESHVRG